MGVQVNLKRIETPAVLLFHSFSNHPKVLTRLYKSLSQAGYAVFTPTFSGHGTGNLDDVLAYRMADWLRDGQAAYQQLVTQGFQQIHVMGLSMGGLVALYLQQQYQQIKSASLWSTPFFGGERDNRIGKYFMQSYRMQWERLHAKGVEEVSHLVEVEQALTEVLSSIFTMVDSLSASYADLCGPLFVGQGLADTVINPQLASRFVAQVSPEAQLTLKLYPEAGHYLTLGQTGRNLAQDVLCFLEKIEL